MLCQNETITQPSNQLETKTNSEPDGSMKETKNESENKTSNGIISGIYKIINKVDGKYYVGSTVDFRNRWKRHKHELNHNKHSNRHLQYAYNKYGKDSFEFMICEYVDKSNLENREQIYLNIAMDLNNSYNIRETADRSTISESTRLKLKQVIKTPEWRNKLRMANIGKKLSKERCQQISQYVKGKSNPRFDSTIRNFKHKETGESFSGSMFDFYSKYNLNKSNVGAMIRRKAGFNSVKGWSLVFAGKE